MMKTKSLLIYAVILIAIILLLRACFTSIITTYQKSMTGFRLDSESYGKTAPKEYLNLFDNKDKIIETRTRISKRRNPISDFFYDSKFYIQIYKMDTVDDFKLTKRITVNYISAALSLNTNFRDHLNETPITVMYKEGTKEKISDVGFTLFGDNCKAVKENDSVAYYYCSDIKNFSIRCKKDEAEDIYGNIKDEFQDKKIPIEIMFLKRNKNLYLIWLTVKNNAVELDPNMLCDFIVRK
jgi:hypothetical protein